MDDKGFDFEAPLLSVRRFSAPEVAAPSDSSTSGLNLEERSRRTTVSRRTSLPFYKPDLKSGPVRHPGVVPFVWENKPGQPKNGAVLDSVGRRAAGKLPPGRIHKDKELEGVRSLIKPGSSVRTRKAVTFAVSNGSARAPDTYVGISDQLTINEKVEEENKIVRNDEVEAVEKEDKKIKEKEKEGDGEERATEWQQEEQVIHVAQNGCHDKEDSIGGDQDDDDDAFSDARDTLSRTESFAMNCSVSGISGMPDSSKSNGSFSTDPQVRDFMMGRFLPAAQAMASESPQYTFRKTTTSAKGATRIANRISSGELRRVPPAPPQQGSNLVLQYNEKEIVDNYDEEEEDEDDYNNTGQFRSKGCGLLPKFCLNGNFGRLNPVPGIKFQGKQTLPPRPRTGTKIKNSLQASLGHPEDTYSWEDVYKHKMVQGYKHEFEDESKLRSESNEFTFSSESPTAEGSSFYRRSATGGTSPYRNEGLLPPLQKGFLGIPSRESKSSKTDGSDIYEKDSENFWETASHRSSHLNSGSASPSLEKTVYMDSVNIPRTSISKTSSFSTIEDTKMIKSLSEKDSEAGLGSHRTEEGFDVEVDSSQFKVSETVTPGLQSRLKKLNHDEVSVDDDPKHYGSESNAVLQVTNSEKNGSGPLQTLLPPPLPKTPSESWLSRTLPSVMSKNLPSQSLLAIGCQPRKQTLQAPMVDQKLGTSAKIPKSQVRRIRFAEVLASPNTPKSQI